MSSHQPADAATRDLSLATGEGAGAAALAAPFPAGLEGRVLFWIAIAFSTFQLVTAAHLVNLSSQVIRAVHVGFLILLAAPLLAAAMNASRPIRIFSWALGGIGVLVALYQWVLYEDLMLRSGDLNALDIFMGVLSLSVLFIVSWRLMGPALPILCGIFLGYALWGQYLPPPLDHRPYDLAQVIEQMSYGTEGIYGTPIYVSSSYIFLFILFGAFLERTGMIRLFTDVSLGLVGGAKGGAAKVAVISSGLMGTISGSGVANVVTTGQFTIPMMKRFGYRPAFAGGVEATASMGGQIMPPVMGAVAFIMAETIGVPYSEVVKAAIIPAILYFVSTFWMVHLEAGRCNLVGMPRDQLPSAWGAVRANWPLVLPLAALVYLLFDGYTPLFSGTVGLALTVFLLLGGGIMHGVSQTMIRVVFWVLLGLATAAFFKFGIWVLVAVLAVLVTINCFTKGGRATLLIARDSLADGAKTALPVGLACAIVGTIVGTMTLTGAATTFGDFVVSIGEQNLFLSLFLTMLTCLILGMGIPTIPNYIITASLAGPALLELGVPLMISHMFVFYFGILADLTPPVALAAFAAAPIAKESGTRIGNEACRIALAGFVIPFMAVYTPSLMLQEGGAMAASLGYPVEVIYIVFKCCLAIGLWGAAAIGYFLQPMPWWERILATLAAFSLVLALPVTDELGFLLAALLIGQHVWRRRRAQAR